MTVSGKDTASFKRTLRLKAGCVIDVSVVDHGSGPRVNINAGATMTSQEAIHVASAIVEARAEIVRHEQRGLGQAPVAGRFVLLHRQKINDKLEENSYATSWDTWEEAAVAFPIAEHFFLLDDLTGREWHPGSAYDWEAART